MKQAFKVFSLGRKHSKNTIYRFFLVSLASYTMTLFLVYSTTSAETRVYCLDSSGSMKIDGRIEAAKEAVIKEMEKAKPGDKIWLV
jgi:hypothetical protein